MVVLLSLLSFIAVAAGVFGLGLGVPIRETWFGASLLMAASVAITGGFVLVGLAAVVSQLRQLAQGIKAPLSRMPRPVRPLERKDERFEGDERWAASRPHMPAALGAGTPDVVRRRYDATENGRYDATEMKEVRPKPRPEEWLRHAQGEIESPPRPVEAVPPPIDYEPGDFARPSNSFLRPAIPLPPDPSDTGRTPAVSPQDIFATIWSSLNRSLAEGPQQRTEASPETGPRPADSKSPTLTPEPAVCASEKPAPGEPRTILRAGVIQQTAYTLFADGSIETQLPEGVMRFASIEEFLGHLESGEG
jgi:hypothetical protein